MSHPVSDTKATFKIGLAMAGAASAGAYTAGVLDFLLEALDSWYGAKLRGEAVPRHDVSLEVASGASAGAMCAALLAVALPYDFPHARLDPQRRPSADAVKNPFYRAWVEDIDILPMLAASDLRGGTLPSLLNCEVLDRILARSLDYAAPRLERPYVARPFVGRYTLGNLRGVPYDVSYRGLMKSSDTLYAHDDWIGFLVGGEDLPPPPGCGHGHARVGAIAASGAPDWQRLGNAALASGAFPLVLKPRLISRSGADYGARRFDDPDASDSQRRTVAVPPDWPGGKAPEPYEFVSVDGGFFNNEPLDLARGVIADPLLGNPPEGLRSNGAVLMIAPLVDLPGAGNQPPLAPPDQLLMPLLWSLMDQCRFRPADVALAHDPAVYNRFLVTPVDSRSSKKGAYWVAGGPLQGFFGFLHADYRRHDYQLGRSNCQRFLREDFRLPKDNPRVAYGYAGLPPEEMARWLDADGELPVIPLLGQVAQDEAPCDWPTGVLDLDALMRPIGTRVDAIFRYYRNELAAGAGNAALRLAARGLLQLGWLAGRGQVLGNIRRNIEGALAQQGL